MITTGFPALHRPLLFLNSATRCLIQAPIGCARELASSLLSYGTQCVGIAPPATPLPQIIAQTGANASLVLLPPPEAIPAIINSSNFGIKLIVCGTPNIPAHDLLRIKDVLALNGTELLGPGASGVIVPREKLLVGTFPPNIFRAGAVAIVGRSGGLTCEAALQTTEAGIGQSVVVGVGRDPFAGQFILDVVKRFAEDEFTQGIIMIGEREGETEIDAARWIKKTGLARRKPTVAFIAGGCPEKVERLRDAGVEVVVDPGKIGRRMLEKLRAS